MCLYWDETVLQLCSGSLYCFCLSGVHVYQEMYGCEWDTETNNVTGYDQLGYDGEDFLAFDLKTETWIAPKQQAVITKQKYDSDRALSARQKNYFTHICPEWLKKYLNYSGSSLRRTGAITLDFNWTWKDNQSAIGWLIVNKHTICNNNNNEHLYFFNSSSLSVFPPEVFLLSNHLPRYRFLSTQSQTVVEERWERAWWGCEQRRDPAQQWWDPPDFCWSGSFISQTWGLEELRLCVSALWCE